MMQVEQKRLDIYGLARPGSINNGQQRSGKTFEKF